MMTCKGGCQKPFYGIRKGGEREYPPNPWTVLVLESILQGGGGVLPLRTDPVNRFLSPFLNISRSWKISHEVDKCLTKLKNISRSWKISHEVALHGRKLVDEDAAPLDPGALWILHIKTWAQISVDWCHLQQRIIGKWYFSKFKKFGNALLRIIQIMIFFSLLTWEGL